MGAQFEHANNNVFDVEVPEIINEAYHVIQVDNFIYQKFEPYNTKIMVGHINARSLPNSIDEIWYILFCTSFDTFGVSEACLTLGTPKDRANTEGYKMFRQDSTHKQGEWVSCAFC